MTKKAQKAMLKKMIEYVLDKTRKSRSWLWLFMPKRKYRIKEMQICAIYE